MGSFHMNIFHVEFFRKYVNLVKEDPVFLMFQISIFKVAFGSTLEIDCQLCTFSFFSFFSFSFYFHLNSKLRCSKSRLRLCMNTLKEAKGFHISNALWLIENQFKLKFLWHICYRVILTPTVQTSDFISLFLSSQEDSRRNLFWQALFSCKEND